MGKKAGILAYSAQQISEYGCGVVSGVRRRLIKDGTKYVFGEVAGNKTKLYRCENLPAEWQAKIERAEATKTLIEHGLDPALPVNPATAEETAISYSEASDYNRRKFDKYAALLKRFELYDGQALRKKVAEWNQKHPARKTSYPSVMRARKEVKERGDSALIGEWGKRRGQSNIPDDAFEYFKSLYLKEGSPSARSCWSTTAGRFCIGGDISSFPSEDTFLRQVRLAIGESALYLARHGFKKWNRKYASYIERDYSNLKAGECWVCDHAQIDVAVKDPATGKPVFPWLTWFVDMKTGKKLGAYLHTEAPNSDHIFMSFFMAAERFGLPDFLYLDNGRDMKCRDFAGASKRHKVTVDEDQAASMLSSVGVTPIFALPYNAPAKIIERQHLKIKQGLSMHMPGYRGGNVVERPEKLAAEIKAGSILDFTEFRDHLYDWLENVLNKMPSHGKVLQGKSSDDQWNLENPVKRTIAKDALRLFCMRTSRPLSIGRNGVKDSVLNVTYWSEWMTAQKGRKVYLRRPVEDFNECWVFTAENDEYLGNATIAGTVPAIAKDAIGKQALKEAMGAKRREQKTIKSLGVVKHVPSVTEIINDQKNAAELLNKAKVEPQKQKVERMSRCKMDKAVSQRRNETAATACPSTARLAAELDNAKRQLAHWTDKIILFESEREEKKHNINHWRQVVDRLQAEWNAGKVIAMPRNTDKKSEPGGVDTRRAQSGR